MRVVRAGIVDVGANTLRLLIATLDDRERVVPVFQDKQQLGLGEEIERSNGLIGDLKLAEAAAVAKGYVRRARKLGCEQIEILVTSPGRQSVNGSALVDTLREATGVSTRVLDAEEEGALAWRGAVEAEELLPATVAVCDVGGGSTQLVVGTLEGGPAWMRSVDVGSLRLTRRAIPGDPPSDENLAAARAEVAASFAGLTPPLPMAALATGGTARGLRRIVGRELGPTQFVTAEQRLTGRASRDVARSFGVDRMRARTLPAGTIVLAEAQRRLGVPLLVARGGLREGAASALLLAEVASATG